MSPIELKVRCGQECGCDNDVNGVQRYPGSAVGAENNVNGMTFCRKESR